MENWFFGRACPLERMSTLECGSRLANFRSGSWACENVSAEGDRRRQAQLGIDKPCHKHWRPLLPSGRASQPCFTRRRVAPASQQLSIICWTRKAPREQAPQDPAERAKLPMCDSMRAFPSTAFEACTALLRIMSRIGAKDDDGSGVSVISKSDKVPT
jgi:hypothetical protein